FLRDKGPEACRVQDTGHSNYAITGKSAELVSGLSHGIERIGNYDKNAVGRILDGFLDHVPHDLVVDVQQVVAAHPWFARHPGRDNDDVGIGGIGVVLSAQDVCVTLFEGHRFQQVQSFSLRNTFDDVNQHHTGKC